MIGGALVNSLRRALAARSPLERQIDAALAARKAQRSLARSAPLSEMQVAARKGAATKRRQRLARDPLLGGGSR